MIYHWDVERWREKKEKKRKKNCVTLDKNHSLDSNSKKFEIYKRKSSDVVDSDVVKICHHFTIEYYTTKQKIWKLRVFISKLNNECENETNILKWNSHEKNWLKIELLS